MSMGSGGNFIMQQQPMAFAHATVTVPDVLASQGDLQVAVTTIVYDSRHVTPGAIFVRYRGFHIDGQYPYRQRHRAGRSGR
jgi:UDP-N-acetylmuramyl pentapeptide synthase